MDESTLSEDAKINLVNLREAALRGVHVWTFMHPQGLHPSTRELQAAGLLKVCWSDECDGDGRPLWQCSLADPVSIPTNPQTELDARLLKLLDDREAGRKADEELRQRAMELLDVKGAESTPYPRLASDAVTSA